jgi:CzcA family heavy metal efflux pump
MLTAIVRISLHHAKLVASAAALFLFIGIYLVQGEAVDIFPRLAPTQVSIITEAPGMVSEQVEQLVTRPVELATLGVKGVASERSESTQGISVVEVRLQSNVDPDKIRDALSISLTAADSSLPAGAGPAQLAPLTSSSNNIIEIGLTADQKSAVGMRDIAQWIVRPRLLAIPGVSRVSLYGGAVRRIEVRARSGDLADSDLGFADVIDAVSRSTSVRGAGFIDTPTQRILIDPHGQALTAADVGAGQIHVTGGAPVRVGDVSDVVESSWPPNNSALIDGKPGVLIDIGSQLGTNAVAITHEVETPLATLQAALSQQGVVITTNVNRPAHFIEGVIRQLLAYLLIGGFLTAILLTFLFRDLRAALISFVTIPLSLLVSLAAIKLFGWTINIMTMGGLIVSLALIADDSVIDVENIVSDLRDAEVKHGSRARALLKASLEVREPVIYATFIVIIAILPIVFLRNAIGALLSPLAVTIIVGCLAAILVALTVTPALALILLNHLSPSPHPSWFQRIKDNYATRLHTLWESPSLLLLCGSVALIGMLTIAAFCTVDLIPPIHDGYLVVEYDAPASTSLAVMQSYGQKMTRALLKDPDVAHVLQRAGRADFGDSASRIEHGEIDIQLAPGLSVPTQERARVRIKSVVASFIGVSATVQPRLISQSLAPAGNAEVAIRIFGEDLTTLDDTALKIANILRSIPNAGEVHSQTQGLAPVVRVDLNFQRLALYGLSSADVLNTVQTAFEGVRAAQTFNNDREIDIAVTAEDNVRRDPEAVGDLLIRSSQGISAPLKYVANVYLADGRNSIAHDNGLRRQIVTVDPIGNANQFLATSRQEIAQRLKLPANIYLDFETSNANAGPPSSLLVDAALSTFAVLAVLFVLYADARASLFILGTTIFAAVGGLIVIALMGRVLSLGTFMGFIVLFGISTRNAILLLSQIKTTLLHGKKSWSAETVIAVARDRFSPIILSACVIVAGLAPIALNANQAGEEILGPMVLVILGGLFTSTLMSLLISPLAVLWLWRSTPFLPNRAVPEI